jgi:hypothetical protein
VRARYKLLTGHTLSDGTLFGEGGPGGLAFGPPMRGGSPRGRPSPLGGVARFAVGSLSFREIAHETGHSALQCTSPTRGTIPFGMELFEFEGGSRGGSFSGHLNTANGDPPTHGTYPFRWNSIRRGGSGGQLLGPPMRGGPLGGRPVRAPLDPLRCPSVRVLVHTSTIRLDSASSSRNSRRFTATEHYQLVSRTSGDGTF